MKRASKLVQRRNRQGYFYIMPFLVGFVCFLLIPLVQSVRFSFSAVSIVANGYTVTPVGWKNYIKAFTIDPEYRVVLTQSLGQMLVDLPFIMAFSLVSAILLSREFHGRTLVRVLFFLPVIISTGVIVTMEQENSVLSMMMNRSVSNVSDGMREQVSATQFILSLLGSGVPGWLTSFLADVIARLYDIISASGLQILIFLSGLHTIPPALYEVSDIEGATAWEDFWKITFPMLSPYLLLNLIYTMIDSLTNMQNEMVSLIRDYVVSFTDFGYGLAISWIYFSIILVLMMVLFALAGRRVYYNE